MLREQLQPQGPVRTIISNQTFTPVSYELRGRVYYIQPGQEQDFTGNNLGSIRFLDPSSGYANNRTITPGTRYRFTRSLNQLEPSEWYNR